MENHKDNGFFCQEPKKAKPKRKAKKPFKLPQRLPRINATETQIYAAILYETTEHEAYAIGIMNTMRIKRKGKPITERAIYKAIKSLIAKGYITRTKTKEYITPWDRQGRPNAEALKRIEKRKAEEEKRKAEEFKKAKRKAAEETKNERTEKIASMIIKNTLERHIALKKFEQLKPIEKIGLNERYRPQALLVWSDAEQRYIGYRVQTKITEEIKERMLQALNPEYLDNEKLQMMQFEENIRIINEAAMKQIKRHYKPD